MAVKTSGTGTRGNCSIFEKTQKSKENFIASHKKCNPKADEQVLGFIADFMWHQPNAVKSMSDQFLSGYCYYFAVMLKTAFGRGEICWAAPYGHIVWVDDNHVPYDAGGVCISDCDDYIPVSYIEEGIKDFMHIPGVEYNASDAFIVNVMEKYHQDMLA